MTTGGWGYLVQDPSPESFLRGLVVEALLDPVLINVAKRVTLQWSGAVRLQPSLLLCLPAYHKVKVDGA